MNWLNFLFVLLHIQKIKSNEVIEFLSIHNFGALPDTQYILDGMFSYQDQQLINKTETDYCLKFHLINSEKESMLKYSCSNKCRKEIKEDIENEIPSGIIIGPEICPLSGRISSLKIKKNNENFQIIIKGCNWIVEKPQQKFELKIGSIYLIANITNFINNTKTFSQTITNFTLMKYCQDICNTVIKCKELYQGIENIFTIRNILFLIFVVAIFLYLAYSCIKIIIK